MDDDDVSHPLQHIRYITMEKWLDDKVQGSFEDFQRPSAYDTWRRASQKFENLSRSVFKNNYNPPQGIKCEVMYVCMYACLYGTILAIWYHVVIVRTLELKHLHQIRLYASKFLKYKEKEVDLSFFLHLNRLFYSFSFFAKLLFIFIKFS